MNDDGKIVLAALLLALGMVGGAYLLVGGNYAPTVTVNPSDVYVSSNPVEHSVSVSSTVSDSIAPDLLMIQLRVQTESSNAKDSQTENAKVNSDLLAKLKLLGLKDSEIKTISYEVQPIYDSKTICNKETGYCNYDSVLSGYRTIHTLHLNIEEIDKGGEIIDSASTAGMNQTFVDYVQFTLKDKTRNDLETTLLKQASADAKVKAEAIVEGMGVTLGKPLSASQSFSYPQPYYMKTGMMDAGAPTELSGGEIEVSATVSVSYQIS